MDTARVEELADYLRTRHNSDGFYLPVGYKELSAGFDPRTIQDALFWRANGGSKYLNKWERCWQHAQAHWHDGKGSFGYNPIRPPVPGHFPVIVPVSWQPPLPETERWSCRPRHRKLPGETFCRICDILRPFEGRVEK